MRDKLEQHYRDMQDIEFTVQQNKLYMLQTRNGKRTAAASLRIAVEMAQRGADRPRRGGPAGQSRVARPAAASDARSEGAAHAAGQGPAGQPGRGVAARSCSTPTRPRAAPAKGEAVILVRIETSPEDIHGMHAAKGILTTRGGMTSHAAVVARGMGRPCVAGAGGIAVDYNAQTLTAGGKTVRAGETITLDGATGEVFVGQRRDDRAGAVRRFRHADGVGGRRCAGCSVRANAETPLDAETARKFGAEGIGLCRTEHMFFDPDAHRRRAADDHGARRARPARRAGPAAAVPAAGFPRAVHHHGGLPVTIRLLDPPLHEFLPHARSGTRGGRRGAGHRHRDDAPPRGGAGRGQPDARPSRLPPGHHLSRNLRDAGARDLRGRAAVAKETGKAPVPEIMIPLVGMRKELEITRAQVDKVAKEVFAEAGRTIEYSVGTMIELPRAALMADAIAEVADFFSFGTNDLTQTVFGLSRDDAGKFLPHYVEPGILPKDPFVSLDIEGVGAMVRIAAEKGRADEARPQARHLRRAWRRSRLDRVLRERRAGLRVVQPIPRAGRAAGRGAGGVGRGRRPHGVSRGAGPMRAAFRLPAVMLAVGLGLAAARPAHAQINPFRGSLRQSPDQRRFRRHEQRGHQLARSPGAVVE